MEAVTGAKKRKTAAAAHISSLNRSGNDKRPRVHAQRKFAQGQAILPTSSSPLKEVKNGGQQSSSSSTASGPTSSAGGLKAKLPDPPGECPKTEDFITFLCLRGTSLCPPELDHFNRATIVPEGQSSGDEESETQVRRKKRRAAKMLLQKPLPDSVQALKKKYTEQRLARSVVTQKLEKASKDMKMNTRGSTKSSKPSEVIKSVPGLRRGLRSSRATRAAARSASLTNSKLHQQRKPSAAAIIAKRKTRMATLTAASKGVSRMLTRLTPRGTSSAAFVRKAKRMPLEGRSLRRRDISVSSDEESEEEEDDDKYQGRKMVCRKTASNVNNEGSDSEEESEEDEETEEESDEESEEEEKKIKKEPVEKKRPGRKTKEAATVLLNMLGQKLSRNSANDDDDISIESLSEATQGKRLVEVGKNSKAKERKPITPSIKKVKKKEEDMESDISSNSKKAKDKSKDKEKKTTKNLLKEMQDRLLEEAKKKIAATPEASPLVQPSCKTEESEEAERITISQKTGYIQVKPRLSTDMLEQEQPQSITQRRLSKNGERTSTPPRKILPKGATPELSESRPHLPVGVVGAALSSSRPTLVNPLGSNLALKSDAGSLTPPRTVPLSQPLLINTSLSPQVVTSMAQIRPMVTSQHMTQPVQLNPAAGSIIMSSNGAAIRMPATMQMQPLQLRPNGGQIPIIMPQLALANGSILQPVTVSSASNSNAALLRPPFYGQHIMTSIPQYSQQQHHSHMQMPQQMTSHLVSTSSATLTATSSSNSKATTDVTTANTEPLVSPGPPMLSPQYQQQHQQQFTPQQHQQNQRHPMPMAAKPKVAANPPVLTPSGLPVTSGAVIRSVVPAKAKNQFAKMPNAGPSPGHNQVRMSASSQLKPALAKTIYSKSSIPQAGPSSSFKVEDESSPYAFEPEPLEIRPSVPYRKQSTSSKSPRSSKDTKAEKAESSKKTAKLSESLQSKMDDLSANFKDMDGSIPLPAELASQLVAQAQAEGANASNETTYFIPLQSNSSGQSFGVAVKLGTEGPPGPDQKVIMKAKLVTQPVGKPLGAKVISATTKSNKDAKKKKAASSSSEASSSSSSSSETSSEEESLKKRHKRKQKKSPKKPRLSSPEAANSPRKKYVRKEATIVPLPVTSPTITSRSHQTCIGTVEAMEKFPKLGQHAHLVEAPVFKPTEAEFKDPMKYIAAIRKEAEPFGMCKIIPPPSFKPECNVDDDMRFTGYNQYVHKLMNRWGPNSKEMAAIKKYLDTQNVTINAANHPMVSGVEIDLPALYHAVQSLGGLTEVIQKKKWGKIAEFLRVPKGTQDRSNKFYDIYCKFLLPYDTLSKVEREELLRLVDEEFEERNKEKLNKSKNDSDKDSDNSEEEDDDEDEEEDDEDDECVLKGKSTSLSAFFRVARNLMSMVFKDKFATNPAPAGSDFQPDLQDVEEEYWRLVQERDCHIQVQQGSIDTGSGSDGYGFPTSRGSSCGRHPWNLKILSNNHQSILRTMGPVMGVTVPTLHLGMLFTTGCWYRDPHGLPWIEYHHTGAPKIWFSIPDSHSIAFYTAMKLLSPTFCRKKKLWLGQDTVMMPPNLLVKHGVSVSRVIQEAGQFIIVFPKAYSSHVCTGYTVSESVYFATRDYLRHAETEFENIRDSRDPMLFPLPKLLLCIAKADKSSKKTLKMIKPLLEKIRDNEYVKRTMISDLGVKATERIDLRSGSKNQPEEDEYECETCSANLYVSFVCDLKEDRYYCLDDAVKYLQTRKAAQRKNCKLLFTHSKEEISSIIKDVNRRLEDEESSDDSDSQQIATRRISELGKEERKEKAATDQPLASTSKPMASPTSSVKQRVSAPNVPPGTSISVSSFSMVKQAAKKAMEGKSGGKKAKPESESEADDESESEDEDASEEEESDEEESDSDSEVQISKEAIKKAEKIKKAEDKKSSTPTASNQQGAKNKRKPPTPSPQPKSNISNSKKAVSKKNNEKKSAKNEGKPNAGASGSSRRRPTKARKAASSKTGNLASELLDMLLSTSNEESNASESEQDSSDEAWK